VPLLPFVIGFALGNLDRDLRQFFGQAVSRRPRPHWLPLRWP
jgi:2-keto-3-deoxygluconate permease